MGLGGRLGESLIACLMGGDGANEMIGVKRLGMWF